MSETQYNITNALRQNRSVYAVWALENSGTLDDYVSGQISSYDMALDESSLLFVSDNSACELVGVGQIVAYRTGKKPLTDCQIENIANVDALTVSYIQKIRAYIHAATIAQIKDGSVWYHVARENCTEVAQKHNLRLETAVAIVAALSPGCPWDRNISDAHLIIQDGYNASCATYKANVRKAVEIHHTGNTKILSGVKVVAFYNSILYPESTRIPCVDRWVLRGLGITDRGNMRVNERAACNTAFQKVSDNSIYSVPALQAIVWLVVRESYNGSVRGTGLWSG